MNEVTCAGCGRPIKSMTIQPGQAMPEVYHPQCRPRSKALRIEENKMLVTPEDKAGLVALPGIDSEIATALHAAGYSTEAAVRAASDKELIDIPGIGEKRLADIRDALKKGARKSK
jgi:ERCC4-type nuclease